MAAGEHLLAVPVLAVHDFVDPDTEFFILLPRAKIGNLPASAKFL